MVLVKAILATLAVLVLSTSATPDNTTVEKLIGKLCAELQRIQGHKGRGQRISPHIQEMLDRDLPYCLSIDKKEKQDH